MADLILLIIYLVLVGLIAAYGGIIAYHVFKYRNQLPLADTKKATNMLWIYLFVGSIIIVLSLIIGSIYWWTVV